MENASKALLIAGETLIGLLVIAGLIWVYRNSSNLFSSVNDKAKQQEIINYNNPFTRLAGISEEATNSGGENVESKIDIYEVVSIINYARDINNNLDNMDGINVSDTINKKQTQNSNYVNVVVEIPGNNQITGKIIYDDCTTVSQKDLNEWIKRCTDKKYNFSFRIDSYTAEGRVNKVTFTKK